MKYANCGASVKSQGKVKKMYQGGFMKLGDDLQKLDLDKKREKEKAAMSSGGMAEKRRKDKAKKDGKNRRGELVEASSGKAVSKKKKK